MTVINHSRGFIFVHVPKCAGTTITWLLSKYNSFRDQEIGSTYFGEGVAPYYENKFGLRKHSTASELIDLIGEENWSRYSTLAFVRNPFDRCLSIYKFLKNRQADESYRVPNLYEQTFDEFVRSRVLTDSRGPDRLFLPQSIWLYNELGTRLVTDIGKVEFLNNSISEFIKKIDKTTNFKSEHIPAINKSHDTKKNIPTLISPESVEILLDTYSQDFQNFDYPKVITAKFRIVQ